MISMLKKLASCIGEFKKETILTPIFVSFECAFDIIIPFLMAFLIDNGINKGDNKTIIFYRNCSYNLCTFSNVLWSKIW